MVTFLIGKLCCKNAVT